MKVLKFGGASVKDSASIAHLPEILETYRDQPLLIVISALGKTTNALEKLLETALEEKDFSKDFKILWDLHSSIINKLFRDQSQNLTSFINDEFYQLRKLLDNANPDHYNRYYDQIISIGEILSTRIVSDYLNQQGFSNQWLDAREIMATNDDFRAAEVNWASAMKQCKNHISFNTKRWNIIQGFIGFEPGGLTTTLGREGSDFSAAILANLLDAEELIIWKDVPGIYNADPKYTHEAQLLPALSYQELVELALLGAKIIHPKTIQPLQKKSIPLTVKSFLEPDKNGTFVNSSIEQASLLPVIIQKGNQILLKITPADIFDEPEKSIDQLFNYLSAQRIRFNLFQSSGIDYYICMDDYPYLVQRMMDELKPAYSFDQNKQVELLIIRRYNEPLITRMKKDKKMLLEQKDQDTYIMITE